MRRRVLACSAPPMTRPLILLCVLATLLVAPAGALAQALPQTPFAPPAETTTTTIDPDDDGGLSSLQQALIVAAGVVFVLGIGLYIAKDARTVAPVTEGELEAEDREMRKPRPDARRRAQAKRARQARKKNRPGR